MTARSCLPAWPWHAMAVDESKKKRRGDRFPGTMPVSNEKTLARNSYTFRPLFRARFIAYENVCFKQ